MFKSLMPFLNCPHCSNTQPLPSLQLPAYCGCLSGEQSPPAPPRPAARLWPGSPTGSNQACRGREGRWGQEMLSTLIKFLAKDMHYTLMCTLHVLHGTLHTAHFKLYMHPT